MLTLYQNICFSLTRLFRRRCQLKAPFPSSTFPSWNPNVTVTYPDPKVSVIYPDPNKACYHLHQRRLPSLLLTQTKVLSFLLGISFIQTLSHPVDVTPPLVLTQKKWDWKHWLAPKTNIELIASLTHCVVMEDSLLVVHTEPPWLPPLKRVGPLVELTFQTHRPCLGVHVPVKFLRSDIKHSITLSSD